MNGHIKILVFIALVISPFFSAKAYPQQPTDCDYWGETATLVAINYDTVIRIGGSPKEAMEETKHLFDYDNHLKQGGMGAAFYGAVFEAIENGKRGGTLHQVGTQVCLSYPAGRFDPDGFGKYD